MVKEEWGEAEYFEKEKWGGEKVWRIRRSRRWMGWVRNKILSMGEGESEMEKSVRRCVWRSEAIR